MNFRMTRRCGVYLYTDGTKYVGKLFLTSKETLEKNWKWYFPYTEEELDSFGFIAPTEWEEVK
jgi:hypothetical protein